MLLKSLKVFTPIAAGFALLAGSSAFAAVPSTYSQDFEAMTPNGMNMDLENDGWRVGANVYDAAGGNFKFFYGLFVAPNGGPGFSSVATGDATSGGVGVNYLNIYSDYNCCGLGGGTPEGHGNGTDEVNALVLQEFTIDAADIGKTVTFTFEAKRPDFVDDGFGGDLSSAVGNNCTNNCTANAFIKTLDPLNGFNTTNLLTEDMTTISQSAWGSYQLQLALTDPLLSGQLLQFGFESFSGNFSNTGVYYDNISVIADGGPVSVFVPVPALALFGLAGLLAAAGVYVRRLR